MHKAVWYVLEFIIIGSVSFLHYNFLGDFHDMKWLSYGLHIINISAVVMIPFIATHLIFSYTNLKTNNREIFLNTKIENLVNQQFLFKGKYEKDKIALRLKNILCFKAQDNYVSIYYLEGSEVKKHLLRSTLMDIENKVLSNTIIRCHRSFIINITNVESYKRVKNKIQLKLKNYNDSIIVTKKHEESTIKELERLFPSN